jgi:hypothetical protein
VKLKKKHTNKERPLPLRNTTTPLGRRNQTAASSDCQDACLYNGQGSQQDCDVLSFDIETILAATDNFSDSNKIGKGGFGPVYMVYITQKNKF